MKLSGLKHFIVVDKKNSEIIIYSIKACLIFTFMGLLQMSLTPGLDQDSQVCDPLWPD